MIVDELRIIGSPQTGNIMAAELIRVTKRALGRRPPDPRKEGLGQLVYPFDAEFAQVAVAYMRTPTRVVRDLYRSKAKRLEPLYAELSADVHADDRTWTHHARTLSIAVRRVAEFPAGERQLIGTVKNAIIDAQRARGHHFAIDAARPDLPLVVRLDDGGAVVVSLDLGGASLSKRGWRQEQGEAPLREHLGAVLLMMARYDSRKDVLVDPMCGSGTIAIEAVLAARATARPLGTAAAALTQRLCTEPLFADAAPLVIGSDNDLSMIVAAKRNAIDAGVGTDIVWQRADIRNLERAAITAIAEERGRTAEQGLIICNPPYGERMDDPDLLGLYKDMGVVCRKFGEGWRAAFIVANPEFETAFGGRPRVKRPLSNGNLRGYFLQYDL